MKKIKMILIVIIILILSALVIYKSKFDNINSIYSDEIAQINIIDKYNNMESLHKRASREEYVLVDMTIDGIYYRDVAIRTKGGSIYNYLKKSQSDRYSYKVKLDYINTNQAYKRKNRVAFK